MKKKILLILSMYILCLTLSACGNVNEDVEKAIITECDKYVAEYDYDDTVLYTVENISYEIREIKKYDEEYFVDILWNIEISDSAIKEDAWNEDWIGKVYSVLTLADITVDGRKIEITHADKYVDDSVSVCVNGGNEVTGDSRYENKIPRYTGTTSKVVVLIILVPLILILIGWPYFKKKIEKAQREEEEKRKAEMEALRATMTDSEWYQYLSKILGTHLSAPNHADGVKCPNCGEYNAERLSTHNSIGQVALNNIGKSYKCHSCGHSW